MPVADPELLAFLKAHTVMTVATVADDGRPAAAQVFYAVDDNARLYFVTDTKTLKARNMLARPDIAITIGDDNQGWGDVNGLQAAAVVSLAPGTHHLLIDRFPDLSPQLQARLTATDMWCATPSWARLVDNRKGFGWKREFSIE